MEPDRTNDPAERWRFRVVEVGDATIPNILNCVHPKRSMRRNCGLQETGLNGDACGPGVANTWRGAGRRMFWVQEEDSLSLGTRRRRL